MKGAIFDFDGTVFDSMRIWDDIDVKFLNRYGHTPGEDMRRQILRLSVWQSAQLFKEVFGIPLEPEEIVREFSEIAFESYKNDIKPKAGVKKYLKFLEEGDVKMCIATTAPRKNVEAALEREKMKDYFEFILSADEVKSSKDSPEIYLKCAYKMKIEPFDTTVFEDTLQGVTTAKNAGFKVISVDDANSYKNRDEIARISDKHILSFSELMGRN